MGILETVLVTAIVATAALYAAWSLLPASLRLRSLAALLRVLDSGLPLPAALRERLRRAAVTRAARAAAGCGQCSANRSTPLAPGPDARRRRIR